MWLFYNTAVGSSVSFFEKYPVLSRAGARLYMANPSVGGRFVPSWPAAKAARSKSITRASSTYSVLDNKVAFYPAAFCLFVSFGNRITKGKQLPTTLMDYHIIKGGFNSTAYAPIGILVYDRLFDKLFDWLLIEQTCRHFTEDWFSGKFPKGWCCRV